MGDFIRRLLIGGMIAISINLFYFSSHPVSAEEPQNLAEEWIWPTDGEITDTFGTRHGTHKGIDIAADPRTPIYAVDGGMVSKSYYSDTYGHVVFIKHKNNFETVYAHLSKRKVKEGQAVHQGDLIGEMGNTGDSTGVHLHFEVHQNEWTFAKENAIDPNIPLGSTEIGQTVYAQTKSNRDDVIETAGYLHPEKKKQGVDKKTTKHTDVRFHIVDAGESLWSLAQQYNTSVEWLMVLNQLEDKQIAVGQRLAVKRGNTKKYLVARGDTLLRISKKTGNSVEEIKKRNRLKDDLIYPKQILIVE